MKINYTHNKWSNSLLKLTLSAFCFLVSFSHTFAQDSITLSGAFQNNTRYAFVLIQKFDFGVETIARIPIDRETGKFSLKIAKEELTPGVYRLQYNQTSYEYLDVILNGEEPKIHFIIDSFSQNKLPDFTHSQENKLWYDYQKTADDLFFKTQLLQQFLGNYPSIKEKVYTQNEKFYATAKSNFLKNKAAFVAANPGTWASEMINNQPHYFANPKDPIRLQMYYQRQYFWDNINAQNPALINSPLYTDLILKYMQYYLSPEMDFSENEMNQGFIKSIDTIMQKFGGNPKTQEFAAKYLQLGFKEIGNDQVLQYIDETYQELLTQNSQSNTNSDEAFEKRMKGYQAMKEGNQAPNIIFNTPSQDVKDLYSINANQTLVVFWASWCPFCTSDLPKVNEWAKHNPDIKVVGISLDDDKEAYQEAISSLQHLVHSSDFEKWESKPVNDYYIYATPTYILLDKDKKIIGKYSSLDSLIK